MWHKGIYCVDRIQKCDHVWCNYCHQEGHLIGDYPFIGIMLGVNIINCMYLLPCQG
jgi:hypothetical protein